LKGRQPSASPAPHPLSFICQKTPQTKTPPGLWGGGEGVGHVRGCPSRGLGDGCPRLQRPRHRWQLLRSTIRIPPAIDPHPDRRQFVGLVRKKKPRNLTPACFRRGRLPLSAWRPRILTPTDPLLGFGRHRLPAGLSTGKKKPAPPPPLATSKIAKFLQGNPPVGIGSYRVVKKRATIAATAASQSAWRKGKLNQRAHRPRNPAGAGLGAKMILPRPRPARWPGSLADEEQSRVVISCNPLEATKVVEQRAKLMGGPRDAIASIGTVGGDNSSSRPAPAKSPHSLTELHRPLVDSIAPRNGEMIVRQTHQ